MPQTRTLALLLILVTTSAFGQRLPEVAPAPADNPLTDAKIDLGHALFFDARLSADGTIACSTCHDLAAHGIDHRTLAEGIGGRRGTRNTPTVWNAALKPAQFWDGRAPTLETQAAGPLLAAHEMGMGDGDRVVARLLTIDGYAERFEAAFGPGPITFQAVLKALASFERTLLTRGAPYDRFMAGEAGALSPAAARGMRTFAEVGCVGCHSGPAFAGPSRIGRAWLQPFPTFASDARVRSYGLLPEGTETTATGVVIDPPLYQVPTLRQVVHTAPYLHDGSVPTLDEVVRVMGAAQLDRVLTDAQVDDLVAFLEALTGTYPALPAPRLPPSSPSTVGAPLR